jgi:hypothetical protein
MPRADAAGRDRQRPRRNRPSARHRRAWTEATAATDAATRWPTRAEVRCLIHATTRKAAMVSPCLAACAWGQVWSQVALAHRCSGQCWLELGLDKVAEVEGIGPSPPRLGVSRRLDHRLDVLDVTGFTLLGTPLDIVEQPLVTSQLVRCRTPKSLCPTPLTEGSAFTPTHIPTSRISTVTTRTGRITIGPTSTSRDTSTIRTLTSTT